MLRESPDAFVLRRTDWQAFSTLTFRSTKLSEGNRVTVILSFLREVARLERVHWKTLLWVARAELGESSGRFHWHVLIGGLVKSPTEANCSFWARIWSRVLKVGIAEVRCFDGRDAVEYILKDLDWTLEGANSYEVGKFRHHEKLAFNSGRSEVIWSDSLRARLHLVQAKYRLNRASELAHDKVFVPLGVPTGVCGGSANRFGESRAKSRNRGDSSSRLLSAIEGGNTNWEPVRRGNPAICNSPSDIT